MFDFRGGYVIIGKKGAFGYVTQPTYKTVLIKQNRNLTQTRAWGPNGAVNDEETTGSTGGLLGERRGYEVEAYDAFGDCGNDGPITQRLVKARKKT